jgi:acyl carrier protein
MEIRTQVRTFIADNFFVSDPAALGDHASLIDAGIVDSTGVLEVISFLESRFGIIISDDEIVPENLDTIARIESFVVSRQRPASAPSIAAAGE